MTLEEVMNNITILNDKTTINLAIAGIGIGLIVTIFSVIRAIKEEIYPRGFWIATAVCFGIVTATSAYTYIEQPTIIKLQISTQTVSLEHLAEYFELSDIEICRLDDDGFKIVCEIKPIFHFFFEPNKENYYDDVAKILNDAT